MSAPPYDYNAAPPPYNPNPTAPVGFHHPPSGVYTVSPPAAPVINNSVNFNSSQGGVVYNTYNAAPAAAPGGVINNIVNPPNAQGPVVNNTVNVAPSTPNVHNINIVTGDGSSLAPGMCTVCRRGRIENSASCCTWLWCLVLFPLGIIPGIMAFYCCCRQPQCSRCGYST